MCLLNNAHRRERTKAAELKVKTLSLSSSRVPFELCAQAGEDKAAELSSLLSVTALALEGEFFECGISV